MSFIMDAVLSIARAIIQEVMNTINAQIQMVMDQVTQPLKAMVQQVVGGIWKGDGATRFVDEMTNEVVPALANIADVGMNFGSLIGNAVSIFNQADSQASQIANSLNDVFNGILSF